MTRKQGLSHQPQAWRPPGAGQAGTDRGASGGAQPCPRWDRRLLAWGWREEMPVVSDCQSAVTCSSPQSWASG